MIQRYSAPDADNKYYLTTSGGGYNKCIRITGSSVLPNCVGYAYGRFMEAGGVTACTLSTGDAENWWDCPDGYQRGQDPRPGAVMCWRKGQAHHAEDGRGHVEVVEQVNDDGSVITTGSNYGGTRWYRHTRYKPYAIGGQTFQGFIYNPYVEDTTIPDYESDLTINGHLYHLYGQADGLRAVVLSPGLNKTALIKDLDCSADVFCKITGCNYFQLSEQIPDQPYGTTYGPISSPLCGVYQTLPNQDSTMYFDLETGYHADCTGVVIDELHNVFSPALIYQPGKNVQYARMVGLSLCNHASTYCFVIRQPGGRYVLGLSDQELTPNQIAQDFMGYTDLESISFIDGGGSAQMMRYLTKEKRVEYTRDTGRATAGCIAFIGGAVPSGPTQDIVEEPQPDEPAESEEEPMTENKPVEQPEMAPVEGWTDPEPAPQDHIILQRIASLMSVKSIITLALTAAFIALVVNAKDLPDDFVNIYTMCISFFFGYQFKKAEK